MYITVVSIKKRLYQSSTSPSLLGIFSLVDRAYTVQARSVREKIPSKEGEVEYY